MAEPTALIRVSDGDGMMDIFLHLPGGMSILSIIYMPNKTQSICYNLCTYLTQSPRHRRRYYRKPPRRC